MDITLAGKGKPLTLKDISMLEEQLNLSLPSEYRTFLINQNGGYFTDYVGYTYSDPEKGERKGGIDIFYSVNADKPSYDLMGNINDYKGRVPYDLIPIGTDAGGNQICLGVSGELNEKVYLWNHEQESVCLIADSFDDFLKKLSKSE